MTRLSRRRFVSSVAAAPVIGLAACKPRRPPPVPSCGVELRSRAHARVLKPEEWDILETACARIIPTDADPGATEAGVVNYIDAQLSLSHFAVFQRLFVAGLRKTDLLARRRTGQPFVKAPPAEQDRVLAELQRGVPLDRRRDSRQFFQLLLTFTLEGFLGDPIYGGNRNRVGWRLVGVEPRAPQARCPYRGAG